MAENEKKKDEDEGVVLRQLLKPTDRFNLRVKADTPVKALAGSIYNLVVVDRKDISMTFVGHGAAGQAFKGIVSAQQMMSPSGIILLCRHCFEKDISKLKEGDETLSVMKIIIYAVQ